jgi:hypothetical protein
MEFRFQGVRKVFQKWRKILHFGSKYGNPTRSNSIAAKIARQRARSNRLAHYSAGLTNGTPTPTATTHLSRKQKKINKSYLSTAQHQEPVNIT